MSIPRTKITNDIKKRARKLFESGVDMFDIHQELKINLGSLYNISARDNWEKGKRKELISILEAEEDSKKIIKLREEKQEIYKERTEEIVKISIDLLNEKTAEGVRKLVKSKAEALSLNAKALAVTYQMDKELYGIKTDTEKLELLEKKLLYEKLKRRLSNDLDEEKINIEKEKLELEKVKIKLSNQERAALFKMRLLEAKTKLNDPSVKETSEDVTQESDKWIESAWSDIYE